jgi:hypothetical protein
VEEYWAFGNLYGVEALVPSACFMRFSVRRGERRYNADGSMIRKWNPGVVPPEGDQLQQILVCKANAYKK